MVRRNALKSRWALRFLLLVGAAMAAVSLVLRTSWAGNQLCTTAAGVLTRLLGQEVALERCELEPLASTLVVEGIRVGGGTDERPVFSARRLLVDLAPLAFGRSLGIERVEIDEPVLDLTLRPGEDDAPDDDGPANEGCLDILRRVHVDELEIRDASANLVLPDGSAAVVEQLGLEVQRTRRGYDAKLALTGASFTTGETRIPVDALQAEVRLDTDLERLGVRSLDLEGAGTTASVRGSLANLCQPELALEATIEAALPTLAAAFAPGMENVAGAATIRAMAKGKAAGPKLAAAIDLRDVAFEEFDLGDIDLQASAALAEKRITLDALTWPVGAGKAIVTGEILLEENLPARVDVRTEQLKFEELLARLPVKNTPVQMTIDSEHHLEGQLAGGLVLQGHSLLFINGFRVRNVPWHQSGGRTIVEIPSTATLDTKVRLTPAGISLDPARATYGKGTELLFNSTLGFSQDDGIWIRVRAPHFDIAHIRSHVAGIPLGGAGEINAIVDGPYSNPLIEGDLDLQETKLFSAQLGHVRSHVRSLPGEGFIDFQTFTGSRGVTTYDATAQLLLGDGDPHLKANLSLREGGRLGDLFDATAGLVSPLAWLRDQLDGTVASATASVEGPLPNIQAQGEIRARAVTFMDRPFDTLAAKLSVPDISRLLLEEVQVTRGGGSADGSGAILFPKDGEPGVDVALAAKKLPLRDLMGSFGEWADLQGEVGARGTIRGPIAHLDIGGELFAEEVSAKGVRLRPTRLSLETQGDQVVLRGPVAGAGTVSGVVRLDDGLPFEATLQLDVPRVDRFLPEEMRIGGQVRGAASASGTLASITDAKGTIDLERLALLLADYRLESQGRTTLQFDAGAFVLPALRLRGENTELFLAGTRSARGALDLQAQGNFDARILDSLVPQIEHANGLVEIKAAVTGTGERPVLVGSADVSRGAFRVKALPIQVQRLSGKLAFSQNQVVVEDATLTVNQGRARLRGAVSLSDFAPDRFDLTLQGDRISWRKPADWPAVVSGRLHLGGAWPNGLLLTGELDVDRLRYARDLELEKMMLDFRQRVRQPPGPNDVERIRLDIDLVGGGDMRVDNNLVKAKLQFVAPPGGGRPRLKLVGNNVRMGLLGAVELVDGIGFFRGNEYRLTHGVVSFEDRKKIDPLFDLTAETEVREYRVAVHAYGRLGDDADSFQLELASEPMLAQADVITLLTFGITSKDLDKGGNAYTGAGVAAEALLAVSGLDDHVKRWLPDTELLLDPEFSVTSQYSEVTGQVEPMATFEAKVLTEQLRLKAAAPFSSAKGRRASAEYRFNERLSTQMVWENEETGYSAGDLGVDVKLRWEWE